MKAQFCFI